MEVEVMAERNERAIREMLDVAATDAGRNAGWIHANYVEAYGSAEDVVSECPLWFGDSATFWQAGFDEGRERFENGLYVDGTPRS